MDDYRNEDGPQGAGEPYGDGAHDGASGFYIGRENVPSHPVLFDPTLPLRRHSASGGTDSISSSVRTSEARASQIQAFADFIPEGTPDGEANAAHQHRPTPDAGSKSSHIAGTVPEGSVIFWDPALPLRQKRSRIAIADESGSRGKDESVRGSHQTDGSELWLPGSEWAYLEKPVDVVLDFDVASRNAGDDWEAEEVGGHA